jgi:hypothetical protein
MSSKAASFLRKRFFYLCVGVVVQESSELGLLAQVRWLVYNLSAERFFLLYKRNK